MNYNFKRFKESQDGAVAIIAAFALIVVIIAVGMAIDYNRQVNFNMAIRNAADTAALQAASYDQRKADRAAIADGGTAYDDEYHKQKREEIAIKAFAEMKEKILKPYNGDNRYYIDDLRPDDNLIVDNDTKEVTVKPTGNLPAFFMSVPGILKGEEIRTLKVSGVYSAAFNVPNPVPASIELVVDNTGSMEWANDINYVYPEGSNGQDASAPPVSEQRITLLKQVITDLVDTLDRTNQQFGANANFFSTGLVAFSVLDTDPNSVAIEEDPNNPDNARILASLQQGTSHVRNSISSLVADGSTDISKGLEKALSEYNNFNPPDTNTRKFVIILTDGANSYIEPSYVPQANEDTKKYCKGLQEKEITIFSIVFLLERAALPPAWKDETAYPQLSATALQNTKAMMQECAENSKDGKFFDANNPDELKQAFEDITDAVTEKIVKLTR